MARGGMHEILYGVAGEFHIAIRIICCRAQMNIDRGDLLLIYLLMERKKCCRMLCLNERVLDNSRIHEQICWGNFGDVAGGKHRPCSKSCSVER